MPFPTRPNPGLCCKRIKKKHELQFALENVKEKDLNFTRKCTSSQIILKTFPRSLQYVYLMLDFKPLLDLSRHYNMFLEVSVTLSFFQLEN